MTKDFSSIVAKKLENANKVFPLHHVSTELGTISYRISKSVLLDAIPSTVIVCLHGIGSGALSWLDISTQLPNGYTLLAWDAPGYGESTPLASSTPNALDYAAALDAWLKAMNITQCILVGHSLGALIVSAYITQPYTTDVTYTHLISPAIGYGSADKEHQKGQVKQQRLQNLSDLGIAGMAKQRYANLLSPHATPEHHAWTQWIMSQLHVHGYQQAIELLCEDSIANYAIQTTSISVACGALDTVTSPETCLAVAQLYDTPLKLIPNVGHASPIESPLGIINHLLSSGR